MATGELGKVSQRRHFNLNLFIRRSSIFSGEIRGENILNKKAVTLFFLNFILFLNFT